jgi:hypothetical protein
VTSFTSLNGVSTQTKRPGPAAVAKAAARAYRHGAAVAQRRGCRQYFAKPRTAPNHTAGDCLLTDPVLRLHFPGAATGRRRHGHHLGGPAWPVGAHPHRPRRGARRLAYRSGSSIKASTRSPGQAHEHVLPRVGVQDQPGRGEADRKGLALPGIAPASSKVHTRGRSIRLARIPGRRALAAMRPSSPRPAVVCARAGWSKGRHRTHRNTRPGT